jgi:hypothetical protein
MLYALQSETLAKSFFVTLCRVEYTEEDPKPKVCGCRRGAISRSLTFLQDTSDTTICFLTFRAYSD